MYLSVIQMTAVLVLMAYVLLETRRTERRILTEVESLLNARTTVLDALSELLRADHPE